jgi:REP element-mobilizing transposase RayT
MTTRVRAREKRESRMRAASAPQIELDLRPRTWGGKRENAGRRRRKGKHDSPHRPRPEHCERDPVHITCRVRNGFGRLRKRHVHHAIKQALVKYVLLPTFRVVHTSIQGNHIHMLVEARDKDAIAEGMRVLEIAMANAINRSLKRNGKVFDGRYHRVDIKTPRQARSALAYVLNNWRRHREDVSTPGAENALVDPYSTAASFDGWRDLDEVPNWDPLPCAEPRTWLLRVGWRRHGLIGVREVPGRGRAHRVGASRRCDRSLAVDSSRPMQRGIAGDRCARGRACIATNRGGCSQSTCSR